MSSLNSHPKPTQTVTHHSPPAAPPPPSSSSSACAACKYQRRRCTPDCTLAPHFPASNPRQFLNVHRLFGVSNVQKILKIVEPRLHKVAMNSIICQANARARDPVGGCYRIILQLKHQIDRHSTELRSVQDQIDFHRAHQIEVATKMVSPNEANYAPAAAATTHNVYGDMITTQQHQLQQQYNNFFYDVREEQECSQIVNARCDNINNILANEIGFDIGLDMLGDDILEMEVIGQKQKFLNEEEMKPLVVDIFGMQKTFEDEEESMDVTNGSSITAIHSSSNTEQRDDESYMEEMLEHDLKSAASFFTLKNCNASAF